jgi:hypothetical protein
LRLRQHRGGRGARVGVCGSNAFALALREDGFHKRQIYPLGQRQVHTEMLSKTIDVDGLKIFCREGGTPGRGKTRNLRRLRCQEVQL